MKLLRTILTQDIKTIIGRPFLWIVAIIFINVQLVGAQQILSSAADKAVAYDHLTKLQKGTLIVVLKSDKKKRLELQKIIDDETSSSSQRKRAEKQLKSSIRERSNFHLDLMESFEQAYTFSEYRFIYDSDLRAFMDGARDKFLNEKLKRNSEDDNTIEGPIYFAREAYTPNTEGTRVLSYIVYDEESKQLKSPFPSVKISNLGPALIFQKLFNKSDYRDGIAIVERFDYMLKHRMASLKEKLK